MVGVGLPHFSHARPLPLLLAAASAAANRPLAEPGHAPSPSTLSTRPHLPARPADLAALGDVRAAQQLERLEEWGKKEAARCDAGDPDLEFCELPGIIDTPPAERSAVEEAWSRGRWGERG